ncbi:hypothetical protein F5Y18DRAFT_406158 [Xylariaceae sp. FL1019]|nr:hypothetical protein F5Y18DRAFT_406158 [Xylariaceae sp. FL1019]
MSAETDTTLSDTDDVPLIDIDPEHPPPPRLIEDRSSQYTGYQAPRPKGVHTKHLTEMERFRVRTLYYDACFTKSRIGEITGYSESQIRTAVRAPTAAIPKRPGRPKKTYPPLPMPANAVANANAALMYHAPRSYFAHENAMLASRRPYDNRDMVQRGEVAQFQMPTPAPAQPTSIVPPFQLPSLSGFTKLPPEIRIMIWRCALSAGPSQIPPSRAWAISVLASEPWLELGTAPPELQLRNPPWQHYVEHRHVPAMILSQVNREARDVVLERLIPIVVSQEIRTASHGIPPFIWIDKTSDVFHFQGEPFTGTDMFENAGRIAHPDLYK